MMHRFVTLVCWRIGTAALAWALLHAPAFGQTVGPAVAPVAAVSSPVPADTLISATSLSSAGVVAPVADAPPPRQPYGFRSVWAQGDVVARLTIVVLLIMSLLSWYIMVAKLIEQRRLAAQSSAAQQVLSGDAPLSTRVQALPPAAPSFCWWSRP
jgi:biopolymer transport protein ExbB